jgi:hypothetical protein
MAIASLDQAKAWLRLESEYTYEDTLIQGLLDATEIYIFNATGVAYDGTNKLAVLLQQVLVCEMYEHRDAESKASELQHKPIVQSILMQLEYVVPVVEEDGEVE